MLLLRASVAEVLGPSQTDFYIKNLRTLGAARTEPNRFELCRVVTRVNEINYRIRRLMNENIPPYLVMDTCCFSNYYKTAEVRDSDKECYAESKKCYDRFWRG